MGSKGATTTSTMTPPKEVADMYKYLTEQGKTLQQQPYQSYTGQMVAELNPMQQQGLQQVSQYSQTAQPYYQGAAAGTLGALGGLTPEGFQQGVGGYMSPYLQNAMGSTAALLANQQAQQRQELLGKTIQQGAFGGDRGKIAQAALAGQQNLAAGEILGKMAQQGYSDAAANYLKSIGAQGGLAAQLGTLGTEAQKAGLQGAQAVAQAGSTPYQVEQAKLAAQYGQFAQQQAYPFQTLGYLANIASGLGAGQGGTSATTQPGPNILGQAFGTALSLATLPYSDRRLKDDVEEVGKTFDGQPIYSFKYKGDDTTHIGLMAQDVEKKHPEAVGERGGYKTVDYAKATEDAADRGKFYLGGASMGGLVPAGQDRQAYALKGAVSLLPYEDDPLSQLMSEYIKVPMRKYIPELAIRGESGIPGAPKPYEDKEFQYIKGLEGLSDKSKINLASNLQSIYSNIFGNSYAQGGLVPRTAHQEGLAATENTVPSNVDQRNVSNKPTSFIEKTFNQGNPYSDEVRAGLLAAGLGMLASRSPFLGTAVGEGAIGGLNTYYNALKNRMEAAKATSEINLQSAQAEQQRAEAKSKGIEAFEKIKQLFKIEVSDQGEIKVYGIGDQPVPLSTYIDSLREVARYFGVPIDQLMREHIRSQSGQASGGRIGKALGGLSGGLDNTLDRTALGAADLSTPLQTVDMKSGPQENSLRDLALSSLKPMASMSAEAKPMEMETKPFQVAQVAPKTTTDIPSTSSQAAEDLHPTLKRIIGLNDTAKRLYKEADDIDGPNGLVNTYLNMSIQQKTSLRGKAEEKRRQALQYETQANELMKVEQTGPGNYKFRWEYGVEPQENPPPKPITAETSRGEIDSDTGRVKTVPVDVGYPVTGGLPTVKLGKHQVLSGDDPILAKATERSENLLKDFYEKGGGTQEGIVNAVKFASALKAVEAGALSGNATALAAVAKDLGFDSLAKEIALGKNIAEVEIALKSNIFQGLATLSQNFPRPTQSEFGVITEKASASVNQQAKAANSLAATSLAAMLWQNSLMRDWQVAQANGVRNFESYFNNWKQLNDRSLFEDAAKRLLGNFKGEPLPSDDKLVEGAVYVVPNIEKGKPLDPITERAYKMGLTGGDVYTVQGVKHYKEPLKDETGKIVKDENGKEKFVDKVKVGKVVKLAPDEVYSTMLQQPGFAYGVR